MGVLVGLAVFIVIGLVISSVIGGIEDSSWFSKDFFGGCLGYIVLVIIAVFVLFFMFNASSSGNSNINYFR